MVCLPARGPSLLRNHGWKRTSHQPAPEPAPAVANYLLTAMHDHGNCHARPDKQRDLWRTALVANPKWGTKRICQSCGTKFYDLTTSPIVCPSCEIGRASCRERVWQSV